MNTYHESSPHLKAVLDVGQRMKMVRQSALMLESTGLRIDAVVGCGVSGIVFGTSLADRLQLPIVIVRKRDESAHSKNDVEGPDAITACHPHITRKQCLFVDDLMASGHTFEHTRKKLVQRYPDWKIMGILLYHDVMLFQARDAAREQGIYLMTPEKGIVYSPPPLT